MSGPSAQQDIDAAILELETRIGLPPGFLDALKNGDDWSFLIKGHALVEAAMSEAIVQHLGRPELSEFVTRLELGDPRTGKIAIGTRLGFIRDFDRRFLAELSKLRNSIVHDIRRVNFTFAGHIASLDANQFREFKNGLSYAYLDEDANRKVIISNEQAIQNETKTTIWHGLRMFLAILSLSLETARLMRDADRMELETAKRYRALVDVGT